MNIVISFVLGISITLNIVFVIGIIIFLSVRSKLTNKFTCSLLDEEIVNKEEVKDFMKNDDIDFSSMFRR